MRVALALAMLLASSACIRVECPSPTVYLEPPDSGVTESYPVWRGDDGYIIITPAPGTFNDRMWIGPDGGMIDVSPRDSGFDPTPFVTLNDTDEKWSPP
jgi:hypothetical protein